MMTSIKTLLLALTMAGFALSGSAQTCDPSMPLTGLNAMYAPGSGALLVWNALPGSVGVQLQVILPSGANFSRRIIGPDRSEFRVDDHLLSPGSYTWRVQAACSTIPPYSPTPISASFTFTVPGLSTCPATVTDIDGNVYPTTEIGSQCWMAENLKVERYRNGNVIPSGIGGGAWMSLMTGASAVYNNNAANKAIYGLLYNWYAATDARGLCPTGWSLPSQADFTELEAFLGGSAVAGGPLKSTGAIELGTGLWRTPNTGATNSSGFNGLPAGYRESFGGTYSGLSDESLWWSSTDGPIFSAVLLGVGYNIGSTFIGNYAQTTGVSVRCLKD